MHLERGHNYNSRKFIPRVVFRPTTREGLPLRTVDLLVGEAPPVGEPSRGIAQTAAPPGGADDLNPLHLAALLKK